MALTRIFVRRVTLTFVLVTLTVLIGFVALRSLVVQEQPNTGLPAISVNVQYSGASTTELRDTIVRPIENALSGTQNLDHIDSTIHTGSAQITAHENNRHGRRDDAACARYRSGRLAALQLGHCGDWRAA